MPGEMDPPPPPRRPRPIPRRTKPSHVDHAHPQSNIINALKMNRPKAQSEPPPPPPPTFPQQEQQASKTNQDPDTDSDSESDLPRHLKTFRTETKPGEDPHQRWCSRNWYLIPPTREGESWRRLRRTPGDSIREKEDPGYRAKIIEKTRKRLDKRRKSREAEKVKKEIEKRRRDRGARKRAEMHARAAVLAAANARRDTLRSNDLANREQEEEQQRTGVYDFRLVHPKTTYEKGSLQLALEHTRKDFTRLTGCRPTDTDEWKCYQEQYEQLKREFEDLWRKGHRVDGWRWSEDDGEDAAAVATAGEKAVVQAARDPRKRTRGDVDAEVTQSLSRKRLRLDANSKDMPDLFGFEAWGGAITMWPKIGMAQQTKESWTKAPKAAVLSRNEVKELKKREKYINDVMKDPEEWLTSLWLTDAELRHGKEKQKAEDRFCSKALSTTRGDARFISPVTTEIEQISLQGALHYTRQAFFHWIGHYPKETDPSHCYVDQWSQMYSEFKRSWHAKYCGGVVRPFLFGLPKWTGSVMDWKTPELNQRYMKPYFFNQGWHALEHRSNEASGSRLDSEPSAVVTDWVDESSQTYNISFDEFLKESE